MATNIDVWNGLREKYPNFASITSQGTKDTFTSKGFSEATSTGALNEFFNLSIRTALNKIDVAKIKTRLQECGLVETFVGQLGGYLQRLSIEIIKPISPAYNNLVDGQSVDPFIVRKPESNERFYECGNFNYQSFITISEFQAKTIFLEEYGIANFISGIMQGLENGYKLQKEVNIYEALNKCINDVALQSSQTVNVTIADVNNITNDELLLFIDTVKQTATKMNTAISTKAFNSLQFDTHRSPDEHILLLRAGIKDTIQTHLMVGAYNKEDLSLPFEIVEVADFGGLKATSDGSTELYPKYSTIGELIGWSTTDGGEAVAENTIQWVDPNANVLGVIIQKGAIFEEIKEPYSVRPIHNPRGLYDNYWASAPNNMIRYDKCYNVIKICKA